MNGYKKKKAKKLLGLSLALGLLAGGGASYFACESCQKWVNSLPERISEWDEASEPVPQEVCKILLGRDSCTENEAKADLQAACGLFGVAENVCEPKAIADKIRDLGKDQLFGSELEAIIYRYMERNSVDNDTLYGADAVAELHKLNNTVDRAFQKAVGVDASPASFDRYVQAWKYRAKLRNIYGLIPGECKEGKVEGASGSELKKDALRYGEIVGFLKIVKEHEERKEFGKRCYFDGQKLFDGVDISTMEDGWLALEEHKEFVKAVAEDDNSQRQAVAQALRAIGEIKDEVAP